MLLELMMAGALWQAASTSSPTAQTAEAPTTAPASAAPRRRGRVAEGVVCENRATTGSVMRRDVCRTERRRSAEARAARDYLSTNNAVNQAPAGID